VGHATSNLMAGEITGAAMQKITPYIKQGINTLRNKVQVKKPLELVNTNIGNTIPEIQVSAKDMAAKEYKVEKGIE
jgi:hypothetical protein